MYIVIIPEKVNRQLKKLPEEVQDRVLNYLDRIKMNPFSHDIRKLVGSPYYRARVGKYRIIIDIKENKLIILVLEIGPRHKIYK